MYTNVSWANPTRLRAERSADGRTYKVHNSEMIPTTGHCKVDGEYTTVTFDDDTSARQFWFALSDNLCR